MSDPFVVTALRSKHAELAGMIEALQDQLIKARIDLDHVDYTLRLFVPDIELTTIKPKPIPARHRANKGQVTRAILAMLRAEGPMDSKAIAIRHMAERELDMNDKALALMLQKRVGAALRNMRDRGLIVSKSIGRGRFLWSLVK